MTSSRRTSGRSSRIVSRKRVFTTPWFSLVAKQVRGSKAPYYSLSLPDYVSIFAVTQSQKVVLVRQFRPAVEGFTLELPSGLLEAGESAEQTARRELLEETGYEADRFELMGEFLVPDTGRIGNRLWCFFAANAVQKSRRPALEAGVRPQVVSRREFARMIEDGRFNHALHLAVAYKAAASGRWRIHAGKGGARD